ncbi:MAG: hypothetical protein AAGA93_11055 [Actinomycetota bacterium]
MSTPSAAPLRASSASSRRRWTRAIFWGLVALSIASLLLSPLGPLIDRVREVGPWVGGGLLLSEVLFTIGLVVMAASVGVRLGRNPLQWRSRLDVILAQLQRSPTFWVGLVINTVGAVGTALVIVAAVLAGLPVSAWGLLVLPAADLGLTVAVRAAVVGGVRGGNPDDLGGTRATDSSDP